MARSGGSTTSPPTRPASRVGRTSRAARSSIDPSAKRATKRGTRRRSGCCRPTARRSAVITRRRCRRPWPTSSTDSSARRRAEPRLRTADHHAEESELAGVRAVPLMTAIPVESPAFRRGSWPARRRGDARRDARAGPTSANIRPLTRWCSTGRLRSCSRRCVPALTQGDHCQSNDVAGISAATRTNRRGFSLEFSPLLSTDADDDRRGGEAEAVADRKMLPVQIEVPSIVAANQKRRSTPRKMTAVQIHERFRWPTDMCSSFPSASWRRRGLTNRIR